MKRTRGRLPGIAVPQGRPRRVPPRGADRPGQAARSKTELRVLIDAIRSQDDQQRTQDESVVFDLVRLLTGRRREPNSRPRADLEKLATTGKPPVTRQLGFVALIAADGTVDKAWDLAIKSRARRCTTWSTPCR